MMPDDLFECVPLRCRLRAGVCAARQEARWRPTNAPVFTPCGTGCAQGIEIRAALPADFVPPKWSENRRGIEIMKQLAAKRRQRAEAAAVTIRAPRVVKERPPPVEVPKRLCAGSRAGSPCPFKKTLRTNSVGTQCYQCRHADGLVIPGVSSRPPSMPLTVPEALAELDRYVESIAQAVGLLDDARQSYARLGALHVRLGGILRAKAGG